MDISLLLKEIRQRALLTQDEFAKQLGVSYTTVNRWETGKAVPNISKISKIKKFCIENAIEFSDLENCWIHCKNTKEK